MVDCNAEISLTEVNFIQRPACVCSPIFSRMCAGSLSSELLKNEKAHDSLSGMTIAAFFFKKVKQALLHLCCSTRSRSSAILRSLSTSLCHSLRREPAAPLPILSPKIVVFAAHLWLRIRAQCQSGQQKAERERSRDFFITEKELPGHCNPSRPPHVARKNAVGACFDGENSRELRDSVDGANLKFISRLDIETTRWPFRRMAVLASF